MYKYATYVISHLTIKSISFHCTAYIHLNELSDTTAINLDIDTLVLWQFIR